MSQIDMFQFFYEQKLDEMVPELKKGQIIYETILDTVKTWTVSNVRKGREHFHYDLYDGSGYLTLLDRRLGVNFFRSYEKAQKIASEETTETIIPELTDYVGWSAIREVDNRKLKYIVAKVGEKQLYWKWGVTYTILDTFENQKERDQHYLEEVGKIPEEVSRYIDPKEEVFEIEKLYKVNDKRFASLDYARRHKK